MSGVVVDTSVWIELVSGARVARDRAAIADLTRQLTLHDTPLDHWIRVGELRRSLKARGISASTPDAHVAQCALDRRALLLSRDAIFPKIARHCELRVIDR